MNLSVFPMGIFKVSKSLSMAWSSATMFLCLIITPFGSPVVPLVYMMVQRSSGFGPSFDFFSWAPFSRNLS